MTSIKLRRLAFRRLAGALLGLASLSLAAASVNAQSVTQGYGSDDVLQRGMIVGLNKDDADKVDALNVDRIKNILGVVVNQNDSPITISGDNERVFVSTSGRYDVLVSNQHG